MIGEYILLFLLVIEDERTRSYLEEIYLAHSKDMFNIAFSVLKNEFDAEDCVQDSILKLERYINRVREMENEYLKKFIFTIAKNTAINQYNRNKGYKAMEMKLYEDITEEVSDSVEDLVIRMDNIQRVYENLKNIKKEYVEIIALRFFYELKLREIADILCISESGVASRLNRAIAALKKEYRVIM